MTILGTLLEVLEEIEAKFDEVIENMKELNQLTRYKGVLQDLCKRQFGGHLQNLWQFYIKTKIIGFSLSSKFHIEIIPKFSLSYKSNLYILYVFVLEIDPL